MTRLAAGLLAAAQVVGPAGGETQSVSEKVRAILSADITDMNWPDAVRDLGSLGEAALPAVAAEIGRLHGSALRAAAERVTASHHRPAAAIVARRLADPEHGEGVMAALLAAVGQLGGDAEVPALAAVAKSPQRAEWARLRAFMALVTIRSEKSVAAAIAALDEQRPERPRMPSAAAFADLIGRPVDEAARERAGERGDILEYLRLGRGQGAAKVGRPGSRTMFVFPDSWLGLRRDLWAEEFAADGRPEGPATFLGVALEGRECPEECTIAAELRGDILSVRRVDTWEAVGTIDIRDVRRDSDGDGFSDLVERRLSLDPQSPDSDGDGLGDAVDPVPNTRTRRASKEVEEITAAIFEQFFAFTDETGQPAVFVGPPSQPLEGRKGPTLVIAPADEERARARYGGLPFIRITPNEDGGGVSPGERRYFLSESTGPKSGASYNVIVTRVSGRWLVRSVEMRMMR